MTSAINIDDMMKGAADACEEFKSSDLKTNDSYQYAVVRNILYKLYKNTEILKTSFTPALFFLFILDKWRASRYNKSVALRNDNIL